MKRLIPTLLFVFAGILLALSLVFAGVFIAATLFPVSAAKTVIPAWTGQDCVTVEWDTTMRTSCTPVSVYPASTPPGKLRKALNKVVGFIAGKSSK